MSIERIERTPGAPGAGSPYPLDHPQQPTSAIVKSLPNPMTKTPAATGAIATSTAAGSYSPVAPSDSMAHTIPASAAAAGGSPSRPSSSVRDNKSSSSSIVCELFDDEEEEMEEEQEEEGNGNVKAGAGVIRRVLSSGVTSDSRKMRSVMAFEVVMQLRLVSLQACVEIQPHPPHNTYKNHSDKKNSDMKICDKSNNNHNIDSSPCYRCSELHWLATTGSPGIATPTSSILILVPPPSLPPYHCTLLLHHFNLIIFNKCDFPLSVSLSPLVCPRHRRSSHRYSRSPPTHTSPIHRP